MVLNVIVLRGMDLLLVNAWRPFSWPAIDNPLALLDWSSVDEANDLCRIPAGLPMTAGEPPQRITHNPAHRWLYVPGMRPDEVRRCPLCSCACATSTVCFHIIGNLETMHD